MHVPSPHVVDAASQRGASITEFVVVAPFLLFFGLSAVQLGLIYHGRTILSYATFEAARAGAVNHALPGPMRRELALRLAPVMGGDGSATKAAEAIARSVVDIESPLGADGLPRPMTTVELLSPTPAAFADWGVHDPVADRTVIPNSHLRHRLAGEAPGESGLSLRDANILEIEVTHGFELKVPIVGRVLTTAMALADPENVAWYAANRLPLASVATVRMQSDAWLADDEPLASVVPDGIGEAAARNDETAPDGESPGSDAAGEGDGGASDTDADGTGESGTGDDEESGEDEIEPAIGGDVCGEYGLGGNLLPLSDSTYLSAGCGVGGEAHAPPQRPDVLGSEGDLPPASSGIPDC